MIPIIPIYLGTIANVFYALQHAWSRENSRLGYFIVFHHSLLIHCWTLTFRMKNETARPLLH